MTGTNLPVDPRSFSNAAEKLVDTVRDIVHCIAGPDRVRAKTQAHAESEIILAKGRAAVQDIEARMIERLRNRETRRQRNIEAITEEALKSLPPPDQKIADEPVSQDFVARFFEECQDVGDKEMQVLWGKLLAGVIAQPGSFHPKTLRIVKDLTKDDANLFVELCRFGFLIESFTVVIFKLTDDIYEKHSLTFDVLLHLDNLGLADFDDFSAFSILRLPQNFTIFYGNRRFNVTLPDGANTMSIGKVLLTDAGRQLASLTNTALIPEFPDYAISNWRNYGIVITPS